MAVPLRSFPKSRIATGMSAPMGADIPSHCRDLRKTLLAIKNLWDGNDVIKIAIPHCGVTYPTTRPPILSLEQIVIQETILWDGNHANIDDIPQAKITSIGDSNG